ncbi:hypothetical protein CF319_g1460 [Tilletia indica]|uniref:Uncharacterized protein n=1 Tax=Tilletia indica TaxID=43049 RepID=A0A177TX67_9BASI|nr:hypothetical protein CF319_g1460 [Tilletia indica]KAE8234807.1 hypothetical protein CF326_g157 [Tilletia indica]KAE8246661.1 hypothetical protein A4X13_0g5683 [Tilletia indica]
MHLRAISVVALVVVFSAQCCALAPSGSTVRSIQLDKAARNKDTGAVIGETLLSPDKRWPKKLSDDDKRIIAGGAIVSAELLGAIIVAKKYMMGNPNGSKRRDTYQQDVELVLDHASSALSMSRRGRTASHPPEKPTRGQIAGTVLMAWTGLTGLASLPFMYANVDMAPKPQRRSSNHGAPFQFAHTGVSVSSPRTDGSNGAVTPLSALNSLAIQERGRTVEAAKKFELGAAAVTVLTIPLSYATWEKTKELYLKAHH